MIGARGDRWGIVPYDADWPAAFEREAAALREAFTGVETLREHVGSTAVPGLGAKPIIDIMLGVRDLADVTSRMPTLREHGYQYVRKYEAQLPDRRYFRKPVRRPRTHHLHAVVVGSPFWVDHLRFRDHLRMHANVARAYYELKLRLVKECSAAGTDYTEAKSPFIQAVLTGSP